MSLLKRLLGQPDAFPSTGLASVAVRSAPAADSPLPTGTYRFITLDVETANESPASICQIGIACAREDGGLETFCTLIDPRDSFAGFNVRLHGIDAAVVQGEPTFAEFFPHLLPLLSRHTLIQHSGFDKRAIEAACLRCGLRSPDLHWIDSVGIARRAWPRFKGNGGHGLGNLRKELCIDFQHHDAGEDARATALVVQMAEAETGLAFTDLAARPRITPPRSPRRATAARPERSVTPSAGVIVFTGSLSMTHDQATELALRCGFQVRRNLSKTTTHLVVGEQSAGATKGAPVSAKHGRAEARILAGQKLEILTETEFLAFLAKLPTAE